MKVLKKRILAFLIDAFVFGCFFVMVIEGISSFAPFIKNFDFLFLALFLLRDLLFINASLGKKIMGLRIYDDKWEKPSVFAIIKRSAITSFGGMAVMYKELFVNGNFIRVFDLEANYAHTRVIDKKVYETIKKEIRGEPGDFAKKMTEEYNRYLRDCYIKG